jgi:hypothetical protein
MGFTVRPWPLSARHLNIPLALSINIFPGKKKCTVNMPKLNENVNNLQDKMVRLFKDMFEQGVAQTEFKSYPSQDMATLFSDIAHSAAWASLFRDEDEIEIKERLSVIFDMFTNGILK